MKAKDDQFPLSCSRNLVIVIPTNMDSVEQTMCRVTKHMKQESGISLSNKYGFQSNKQWAD